MTLCRSLEYRVVNLVRPYLKGIRFPLASHTIALSIL